ncbi:Oidioi.mRNA.OKI2018_I69.PAR.g10906.t1.cds [Oikopleura dioica]|uniref:Pleckstrin homology domain-containing family A member 8 n=1 Tax=Oikopleura dioica TaxID=34765 RepID=A0ABN7S0A8_OIKDI|nr:Oidioi.mRNA.OKI2018_I69.PAR.g10906.t1.cds [Oikopleura dioica]
MLDKAGILEKWTNYWLGWQPRYFSLENGILSYYQSEDEVVNGAKSAIRISGADVQLDPVDPRRFDISIGNGQRFSVRAQNEQERQSWIIALAATKQKSNEIGGLKSTIKRSDKSEKVTRKSTELKLFCDLLKQQTTDLQDSLVIDVEKDEKIDPQALNEKTKMLSATCDTFLKTLNDTMKLFEDAKNSISSPPMSPKSERKGFRRTPSTTSLPTGLQSPNLPRKTDNLKTHRRTNSSNVTFTFRDRSDSPSCYDTRSLHSFHGAISELDTPDTSETASHKPLGRRKTPDTLSLDLSKSSNCIQVSEDSMTPEFESPNEDFNPPAIESKESVSVNDLPVETPVVETEIKEESEEKVEESLVVEKMFFNEIEHSFAKISMIHRNEELEVPVDHFLSAAGDLLPILDKLGSKAFAPVKMDINGNITKIRKKCDSEANSFETLQDIIRSELSTGTTKVSNSATDAIMWLKRALSFVAHFLENIVNGEKNLTTALQKAYSVTLSNHHSWVVKGVFALAVKAAPDYKDFIRALSSDTADLECATFQKTLHAALSEYTSALQKQLSNLHSFYLSNNLESNKLV